MRTTKKSQQGAGQAEIILAIKALASEKDISEEMLFNAIEEALKAAFKKNVARDENPPSNLSVTLDRNTGVAHVFARKTIVEEIEDNANQITLEEALKIRGDYRMGDIAEIDVTPNGFLRTAAQTAKQVIMQRIREAEQGKIYDEYSEKENELLTAIVQAVEPKGVRVELAAPKASCPRATICPARNIISMTTSRSTCWRSTALAAKCCAVRRCVSAASIPALSSACLKWKCPRSQPAWCR